MNEIENMFLIKVLKANKNNTSEEKKLNAIAMLTAKGIARQATEDDIELCDSLL